MATGTRTRTAPAATETVEAPAVTEEQVATALNETPTVDTLIREDGETDEEYDGRVLAAAEAAKAAENDPFGALEEASEAEYVRGARATDWEAVTSPRIKADLLKSFSKYEPARDSDGNELVNKPGKSHWLTQKFPTAAMAAEYVKQAKKYAGFKDWTFRSGFQGDTTVRFCAKPRERKL